MVSWRLRCSKIRLRNLWSRPITEVSATQTGHEFRERTNILGIIVRSPYGDCLEWSARMNLSRYEKVAFSPFLFAKKWRKCVFESGKSGTHPPNHSRLIISILCVSPKALDDVGPVTNEDAPYYRLTRAEAEKRFAELKAAVSPWIFFEVRQF